MTTRQRRYAGFDIETMKDMPEGERWQDHRPLRVTCAALYAPELGDPITWHGFSPDGDIADQMEPDDLALMVRELDSLQRHQGFTIVTWNGLGFDFDFLDEESGLQEECQQLALAHIDMMWHVFCKKGYPL